MPPALCPLPRWELGVLPFLPILFLLPPSCPHNPYASFLPISGAPPSEMPIQDSLCRPDLSPRLFTLAQGQGSHVAVLRSCQPREFSSVGTSGRAGKRSSRLTLTRPAWHRSSPHCFWRQRRISSASLLCAGVLSHSPLSPGTCESQGSLTYNSKAFVGPRGAPVGI